MWGTASCYVNLVCFFFLQRSFFVYFRAVFAAFDHRPHTLPGVVTSVVYMHGSIRANQSYPLANILTQYIHLIHTPQLS
ncbi:hypothetical protein BKA82DRAFT_4187703 [Pisolithus tinctorius]|nr:hypothetical protein BKA82DRAFT_4187703 [Pisolithus tinctorius]